MKSLVVALFVLAGQTMFAAEETRPQAMDAERTALAVEALSRLQNVDLNANPKLKEAVLKVLTATRGTPAFVKLVKQFKLEGQNEGLLDVAIAQPADEAGIEAIGMLLDRGETNLLRQAIASTNTVTAARAVEALANTTDKVAFGLILPVATNVTAALPARKQAVRGLARTTHGAATLLRWAREGSLDAELKFTAGTSLSQVRWPEIRAEALKLLPLPEGLNAQPLPPLSELLQRQGDVTRGEQVFRAATTGCAKCHQVQGIGPEVGPNLSEIGSKLGKDALYEAILDPSAGISFGFEAWQLELDSGEEAYGLIASETADEIAIKDTNGVVSRHNKSTVKQRTQMKLSIMPSGLQQTMSVQALVDLVEYLASLKKPSQP